MHRKRKPRPPANGSRRSRAQRLWLEALEDRLGPGNLLPDLIVGWPMTTPGQLFDERSAVGGEQSSAPVVSAEEAPAGVNDHASGQPPSAGSHPVVEAAFSPGALSSPAGGDGLLAFVTATFEDGSVLVLALPISPVQMHFQVSVPIDEKDEGNNGCGGDDESLGGDSNGGYCKVPGNDSDYGNEQWAGNNPGGGEGGSNKEIKLPRGGSGEDEVGYPVWTSRFSLVSGSVFGGPLGGATVDPLSVDISSFRGAGKTSVSLGDSLVLRLSDEIATAFTIVDGTAFLELADSGQWQISASIISLAPGLMPPPSLTMITPAAPDAAGVAGNSGQLILEFHNITFIPADGELPGYAVIGPGAFVIGTIT